MTTSQCTLEQVLNELLHHRCSTEDPAYSSLSYTGERVSIMTNKLKAINYFVIWVQKTMPVVSITK